MEKYLKDEERITLCLRSLYSKYGYLPYKMNKFEEYDLYAKNKDFLIGDGVITFTDTSGKLLALKPDVTLSIIKNASDESGIKNKVYYNENVYRISGGTREYKEIMQTGLECIGDIDLYDAYEVVSLARKTLEAISSDYVLEISHMGIIFAILNKISDDKAFYEEALECIEKKSTHEIKAVCAKYALSAQNEALLCQLATLYGKPSDVLARLDALDSEVCFGKYLCELKTICELLCRDGDSTKIRLDFSIVNDMKYYNGFVINGYINGICECVLYGGCYDKLLQKMGKSCRGMGFAIYTDLLSQLNTAKCGYDVDTLIIYSDTTSAQAVKEATEKEIASGKSVSAQRSIPKKLRYREIIEI